MVTITNHGGSCCGARHIYGFDGNLQRGDVDGITRALSDVPFGRRVEAILNGRQVTSAGAPAILQRLADLGFVLTEHYMNHNHNPARDNWVFTRCDTRRSLTDLPFDWTGQVISAGLHADLPRITTTATAAGNAIDPTQPIEFEDGTPAEIAGRNADRGVYVRLPAGGVFPGRANGRQVGRNQLSGTSYWNLTDGIYGGETEVGRTLRIRNRQRAFQVGDTVQIISEQATDLESSLSVTFVSPNTQRVSVRVGLAPPRSYVPTSLRLITRINTPAPAAPVAAPHRHREGDNAVVVRRNAPVAAAVPVAPPPVAEPTVVFSSWHNRYQDGRMGAGYENLTAARAAAPRCNRQVRKDVFSDGRIRNVDL